LFFILGLIFSVNAGIIIWPFSFLFYPRFLGVVDFSRHLELEIGRTVLFVIVTKEAG
jgi:hypothetical protein